MAKGPRGFKANSSHAGSRIDGSRRKTPIPIREYRRGTSR